ncbi:hypothetical protein F5883DRAFT_647754 [Diaporthe sp. PMI_573]|nr:hypothetical protein F5883DRAFT_647754 [Diaporthaceae sp. PMI_573]
MSYYAMRFLDPTQERRLDKLLSAASECCSRATPVTILDVKVDAKGQRWGLEETLDEQQLRKYLDSGEGIVGEEQASSSVKPTSLRVFFIKPSLGDDQLHTHINPHVLKLLHERAGLTANFMADVYESPDWTVFPTVSSTESKSSLVALQYGFWFWRDGSTHAFTQLVANAEGFTYFCINFPDELKRSIIEAAKGSSTEISKPLFLDTMVANGLLKSYRDAVESQRTTFLRIEKDQDRSCLDRRAEQLHKIAIKWHTIRKDLSDIEEHIVHLRDIAQRGVLLSTKANTTEGVSNTTILKSPDAVDTMKALESTCKFWSRWVTTYLERTNIRINLMHHLATQNTSTLATDVALQTQRDSVSMFTLAMVTAVFLPGTFVCSVLSTTFFSYDGNVLAISGWWWILPLTAAPLTGLVMFLWFWWFRQRLSRDHASLQTRRDVVDGESKASLVGSK